MTSENSSYRQGSAHVDGRIVPISEAKISLLDWGFLHSDATYDVVHVWQGSFFRLHDHIQRFYAGMEKLHMSLPYSRDEIANILADCVGVTGMQDAYVEMICTRGQPEPGSRDPRSCRNQFFAFVIPFVWIFQSTSTQAGLHLIVSEQQRIPPASLDPRIKNYHWLDMVTGLFEAFDRGGETAVLVDDAGNLVEGPGFNIFAVNDNCLLTPLHGVLEGITRRTTMEIADQLGIDVELRAMSKTEAYQADELFITSTAGGIMPVVRIDDQLIGQGKPGEVTIAIQKRYWELHELPDYRLEVSYS